MRKTISKDRADNASCNHVSPTSCLTTRTRIRETNDDSPLHSFYWDEFSPKKKKNLPPQKLVIKVFSLRCRMFQGDTAGEGETAKTKWALWSCGTWYAWETAKQTFLKRARVFYGLVFWKPPSRLFKLFVGWRQSQALRVVRHFSKDTTRKTSIICQSKKKKGEHKTWTMDSYRKTFLAKYCKIVASTQRCSVLWSPRLI